MNKNTRYEGKTAEEWAEEFRVAMLLRDGQAAEAELNGKRAEAAEDEARLQRTQVDQHKEALALADKRITELEAALDREKLHAAQWALRNEELEAKLDAVEIDNLGHAHALSMLRGLFGLPLDGTLYDEIWQKHLELMKADNARLRAVVDYVQRLADDAHHPVDAGLAQLLGQVENEKDQPCPYTL
jgi:hypothetical protein